MNDRIAVIGAGPSGILAAGTAASRGKEVTLFEKNSIIGKKLLITGGGRCNITNKCDIQDMINHVVVNRDFMYSAFYSFTNDDIIELLKKYGVYTKVESKNRVFPKTDKSIHVVEALTRFLNENNVKLMLNCEVVDIELNESGKFVLYLKNKKVLIFDKVIISTGGKTYRKTGATGLGYEFAKKFGHTIVDLKPSLVPIEIKEPWVKYLQGISLENVCIKAYINDKIIFKDYGELIFTHYGISGPTVLNMSNYLNKYNKERIKIVIDLKPDLSIEELDKILVKNFEELSKKQIKNSLNNIIPKRIATQIIEIAEINGDKLINQITKQERRKIIDYIKNLGLTFLRFRPLDEAMITSGGVSVKEINPSTMESRIIRGLYFTGEIIDVDALTGGFNLQIAYSTGYLAGINC